MKQCSRCKEFKNESEFSYSQRSGRGFLSTESTFQRSTESAAKAKLSSRCKKCSAIEAREFRQRYKERTGNSNYRGSGRDTKYPKEDRKLVSAIRVRLTQSKNNNARKDAPLAFNMDEEFLYNLFKKQKGLCALSGVPIQIDGNTNLRLSIDKIIPSKGYVKGNVQWTIFAANRAKGDLEHLDFIRLCKLIIERATTIENTSK